MLYAAKAMKMRVDVERFARGSRRDSTHDNLVFASVIMRHPRDFDFQKGFGYQGYESYPGVASKGGESSPKPRA